MGRSVPFGGTAARQLIKANTKRVKFHSEIYLCQPRDVLVFKGEVRCKFEYTCRLGRDVPDGNPKAPKNVTKMTSTLYRQSMRRCRHSRPHKHLAHGGGRPLCPNCLQKKKETEPTDGHHEHGFWVDFPSLHARAKGQSASILTAVSSVRHAAR